MLPTMHALQPRPVSSAMHCDASAETHNCTQAESIANDCLHPVAVLRQVIEHEESCQWQSMPSYWKVVCYACYVLLDHVVAMCVTAMRVPGYVTRVLTTQWVIAAPFS